MALTTPTIKEIQTNIISGLETKFGQTVPILEKAVWRVLALILAGVWIVLYKIGSDAFKQRFVQTANDTSLQILGELLKVFRQAATVWEGEGEVESTTTGTLAPGTQLVNNNTGTVYLTKTQATLIVGTVTLELKAGTGGAAGDLQIGDIINFVSPIPGLADSVETTLITIAGEDQEDIEVYRRRVLDAYQKKPQGGASADYEQWSEEAPNVINAYPFVGALLGQVNVYIEVDNQTDGIPTAPQLTATLAYINFDPETGKATRRQTGAEVFTLAISRRIFDTEIVGLSPDTAENKAFVEAAVIAHLLTKEPYIEGLSITRNDAITRSGVQTVIQLVVDSIGATISNVNLEESGAPVDLEILGEGEKAKSGVITYV